MGRSGEIGLVVSKVDGFVMFRVDLTSNGTAKGLLYIAFDQTQKLILVLKCEIWEFAKLFRLTRCGTEKKM